METFEIYRGFKRNIVDTSRAAPGVVVAWWSACGSTADELLRAVGGLFTPDPLRGVIMGKLPVINRLMAT